MVFFSFLKISFSSYLRHLLSNFDAISSLCKWPHYYWDSSWKHIYTGGLISPRGFTVEFCKQIPTRLYTFFSYIYLVNTGITWKRLSIAVTVLVCDCFYSTNVLLATTNLHICGPFRYPPPVDTPRFAWHPDSWKHTGISEEIDF